ncbi:unnamed protein product [Gongylonema pulchrum]|uniref:Maltoporin n=1 Tax=Gongylonema pulchrum TaxID=637853 RepID=A0A183EGL5_9BILA|nr:unnamed protein product [Gongylonema pulchrum]
MQPTSTTNFKRASTESVHSASDDGIPWHGGIDGAKYESLNGGTTAFDMNASDLFARPRSDECNRSMLNG